MRFLAVVIASGLVACGAGEGRPPATAHVAVPPDAGVAADAPDATPDATPDAAAVGAVPVPDPFEPFGAPPIEEVDTSIADAELPATTSGFARRVHVQRSGRQLIALHVEHRKMWLSIVEDQNGIVKAFPLEPIDSMPELHTINGDAYAPREGRGTYDGAILFAVRFRPTTADAWRQLVVYAAGFALHVVERPLGATAWKRVLRVELEPGATFDAIGTTDPH